MAKINTLLSLHFSKISCMNQMLPVLRWNFSMLSRWCVKFWTKMLWCIGGVFTFLKKCCVVLVLVDQDLLKMSHICLDLAKFHVVHHWFIEYQDYSELCMSNTKGARYTFGNGKFVWHFWYVQKKHHVKTNWNYLIHFLLKQSFIELSYSAQWKSVTGQNRITQNW